MVSVRECDRCGGTYAPWRASQRFCSVRCERYTRHGLATIPADRLHARITRTATGCWEVPREGGRRYGTIKVGRRHWLAHRFSYAIANGKIPAGLGILHRCDNTWCVNPEHLWAGTHQDNMRDMARKGRGRSGNTQKPYCPKGHMLSGWNVHVEARGSRICVACWAERERIRRARRAAA